MLHNTLFGSFTLTQPRNTFICFLIHSAVHKCIVPHERLTVVYVMITSMTATLQ